MFADVSSANIVGYAKNDIASGIYYFVQDFKSLSTTDGGATLGDFVPSDGWVYGLDQLTIKVGGETYLVPGTSFKSVFVYLDQNKINSEIDDTEYFIEVPEEGDYTEDDIPMLEEHLAIVKACTPGWYLYNPDNNSPVWECGSQNALALQLGQGVMLTSSVGGKVTNAGQVVLAAEQFDILPGIFYTGNITPVTKTLADFLPSDGWVVGLDQLTMKKGGEKFKVADTGYDSVFVYIDANKIAMEIDDTEYFIEVPEEGDYTEDDIPMLEEHLAIVKACTPGWYLYNPDNNSPVWECGARAEEVLPSYGFMTTSSVGGKMTITGALD